jgi:hypothetical protein
MVYVYEADNYGEEQVVRQLIVHRPEPRTFYITRISGEACNYDQL